MSETSGKHSYFRADGETKFAAVCLAAAVLLTIFLLAAAWPSITGDSAIHLVYARNFAQGHPFEFNTGEKSFGCTSPAWQVLQGLCFMLFPEHAIGACALQAATFHIACVFLAAAATWAVSGSKVAAGLAAIAWSICAGAAGAVSSMGCMETMLCVCLIFGGTWLTTLLTERKRPSMKMLLLLGIVLGLLPLVRPEAAIYSVCFGLALLASKWRASRVWRTGVVACGLVAIGVMLPYYIYQMKYTGRLVPDSGQARLLLARDAAIPLGPLSFSEMLILKLLGDPPLALLLIFSVLAISRARSRVVRGALAAAFALNVVFWTFVFPMRYGGYNGRYWQLVWPPLAILGCAGINDWYADGARKLRSTRWLAASLAALAVLWSVLEIANVTAFHTNEELVPSCNLDLCRRLEKITPPEATILTLEVQSRFFLDRRVLSMDGMTDGKILPYLRSGSDLCDFLLKYRPDYVIYSSMLASRPRSYRHTVLLYMPSAFVRLSRESLPPGTQLTLTSDDSRYVAKRTEHEIVISKAGSGVNFHFATDRQSPFWHSGDVPIIRMSYGK